MRTPTLPFSEPVMIEKAGLPVVPSRPRQPARNDGQRGSDLICRWLLSTSVRSYRVSFYVVVGVLLAIFAGLVWQGPAVQVVCGHDNLCFLDAAWKVRQGILPHADYHSALGPLDPWLFAAGMWVLGPTAEVLPFCLALVGVGVGLLAWIVGSGRLPAVPAAVFALTQAAVATATSPLRFSWLQQSYAGHYNRQGYALVSILMLLLFLPRRQSDAPARNARRDGWLAGGILGTLLFLKISYFLAGGCLCLAAFVLGRRLSRPLAEGLLLGFGLVAVACLPLFRFDVSAMVADLRMAAGARGGNVYRPLSFQSWLEVFPTMWIELVLLATAQRLLNPRGALRQGSGAGESPTWLEFGTVAAVEAFLYMTNMWGPGTDDAPLLTSWIFVLLGTAMFRAVSPEAPPPGRTASRLPTLCCLAGILWIFSFGQAAFSLACSASPWQAAWKRSQLAEAPLFESDSLADLRVVKWGRVQPMPVTYAEKVNDGLRALRRLGGVHCVECMDFDNPFPFALQWPSAHGGMWCWHNDYSFGKDHHPAPTEAFGDADVLMVPTSPGVSGSFPLMAQLYGDYVKTHFQPVERTGQWLVLRRR